MRSLSRSQRSLFLAVLAAALVLALFPIFPRQLRVQGGEIASRDILSPRDITFVSDLLTERAREDAARAVPEVLEFDPNVRSRQLLALATAMAEIGRVRENDSLDETVKRRLLLDVGYSRSSVDIALALSRERWRKVVEEATAVLGGALSESIATDAAPAVQDGLLQGVSPDLSADEANLVADLMRPLVTPTLVVNEGATEEAREAATQNVEPVQQSISEGQRIVEGGQPIDATAVEILEQVGLLTPRIEWRNVVAVAVIASLAALILAFSLSLFSLAALASARRLIVLALVIALPVLLARLLFSLVLPDEDRRFLAYFLPLAAAPMLVATLLDARLALVIGLVQAALMMFAVVYLPDLSLVGTIEPVDAARVLLVYGLGGVAGVLAVQRAARANQYLLGGIVVAAVALAVLFAAWLLEPERQAFDALWMAGAALANGLGSGLLTAGGFTLVGGLLGVTTRVQLMELAQLNAPLLRRLQDEAPGTFHHSVIVGNLAERAADLVGADALLVRVGCYYHDIGKILQPGFYIENQLAGDNPHDSMDPRASARIISQHVQVGLELAGRYGLPARVQAFIPEHHGTRLVPYFYRVASQGDPSVDPDLFRYPGPRPQSRETAIVMLADSTEATVRASDDHSPERIDAVVEEVVAERLAEGELDECDLTLRDIRTIVESFKQTLRGVYHPRIAYPEPTEPERRVLIGRFRPGRRAVRRTEPGAAEPLPEPPVPFQGRRPT